MPDTFNCPNCGAPLDYRGSDPMIRCPYCNSSVIVPANLRAQPSFSSQRSNFTLTGFKAGSLQSLVQQAQRFKEVRDLAQAGQIERAVAIYREITGASDELARPAVEALGRGQPIVLSNPAAVARLEQGMARLSEGMAQMEAGVTQMDAGIAQAEAAARGVENAARAGRRIGCLIGCFVVGILLFVFGMIAVTTIVPLAAVGGASIGPLSTLAALPTQLSVSLDTPRMTAGGEGGGPGLFQDVRAIAVNPASGAFFAAEYDGGRVQAFDSSGRYLSEWTVGDGKAIITSMSADRKGSVYIAADDRILRYDAAGKLKGSLETGEVNIKNLMVGPDGNLLAADDADNVYRIAPDGKILKRYKSLVEGAGGDPDWDIVVAADGYGNLFVLSPGNNSVYAFSSAGKFVNRFGGEGSDAGQLDNPSAIAVDNQGRVVVSDFKGVQVFDASGRFIKLIRVSGHIYGLAFDDRNNLYVTTSDEKIFTYSLPNTSQ